MSATSPRLVLASASPARLRLLEAAGLRPEVRVSGVDEDHAADARPLDIVAELAERKASAVSAGWSPGTIVLGCDSMLDVDGVAHGKPADAAEALRRWQHLRGRAAVLVTGHCLVDVSTGRRAGAVAATTVHFGSPTDDELAAYVATGEPLAVAGAFTLDGYAAPFIEGVEGDPGNVIGVSLPLLRRLLGELDVSVVDLWR